MQLRTIKSKESEHGQAHTGAHQSARLNYQTSAGNPQTAFSDLRTQHQNQLQLQRAVDGATQSAQLKAISATMDVTAAQKLSVGRNLQFEKRNLNVQSDAFMRHSSNENPSALQLKTVVENMAQPCKYGPSDALKTVAVGKSMHAWLDPDNPLRGQSANVNTSQDPLMAWVKSIYPLAKGGMSVKGHLLNDNLGGTALDNNLYPISKGANGMHLSTAENFVKKAVWGGKAVKYSVEVDGANNYSEAGGENASATFKTTVRHWNDVEDPDNVGDPIYTANIVSNLGTPKVRSASDANGPLKNISGYGLKPKVKPTERVGELGEAEQKLRNKQPAGLRIEAMGSKVKYEQKVDTSDGALGDSSIFGKAIQMMSDSPSEFVESYIDDNCRNLVVEAIEKCENESDAIGLAMQEGYFDQFLKALPKDLVEMILTHQGLALNCEAALITFVSEEFEVQKDT